jgi:TonB-linked SusC/RagA family outer membrane protein
MQPRPIFPRNPAKHKAGTNYPNPSFSMIKFYLLKRIFVVMLMAGCVQGWAQSFHASGKVTSDDDGSPLPGVSILEKGTSNGTVTDADGNFSISTSEKATLVFSFVGYASQEVLVAAQNVINVSLKTDITALSEIVVVGYGQQERKDVTGSIVAVTAKDFNRGVLTSPQDMLVGKVAGVQVTTNSGAPGSNATIRIRGGSSLRASNDPLIVIDGFPVDNKVIGGASNPLATLNPNDIETFTVLKDASATAIYGSRASNGVIIITTKKGKDGKPQITYNGNFSISTPAKYFDVLSADEYRELVNKIVDDPKVSGLDAASLNRLGNANTDWQKEIYRNAFSHDHNVSVSGSARNLPYRVSYGYTDQNGIMETTYAKRNSLNVNLSPSFLNDNLKVNISAKGSNTKNNFGNTGAIGAAVGFDPTQPVMNNNTRYGGYFTWVNDPADPESLAIDLAPNNPVALLSQTNNTSTVNRLIGNVQVDYRFPFLPALRVNMNTGIDYTSSDGINNTAIEAPWAPTVGAGQKINYTGKNKSKLFDLYLNYVKSFGEHKIDLTGGYSYQSFRNDGSNFSRNWDETDFYDSEIDEASRKNVARQYIPELSYLLSFFGRAHYSFADKYLLTATVRSDGSSRFSKENRWALFPSAAFGWNVIEEDFMQAVKAISNMKLRVGYGITGQQNILNTSNPAYASYPYSPQYIASTPTAQYEFGSGLVNTLRPNPYDASIKWEGTATLNAGIDFGFIHDRITGSIDVYQRQTKDLINEIPIPAGSNFSNYLITNVGTLKNKGIEIALSGKVIDTEKSAWTVGFNFTSNKNEITKLTLSNDPSYLGDFVGAIAGGVGNNVQINSVGHPANSYFVFQQIYDAQGRPIEGLYANRSGMSGSVTSNLKNKYHYYSPYAKYLAGINSTVRYGNFDLYVSGRLSVGNHAYNNRASASTYKGVYVNTGFFNNVASYINDTGFYDTQYWSSYYVENASFFKMDNISFGYNASKLFSEKVKARMSLTVQNAFVITKYSGIDPEVNDGTNPGIDNNIYPRPRTFVLGINLTF